MIKYLAQHSMEVAKTDGIVTLMQEVLKYVNLYHSPPKLVKWWLTRLANVGVVAKYVQGSLMLLDLSDKGIHRDLYLYGIREPQATRYLNSILHKDWTVVDIGANIGYYALQEARKVKQVIAIEPTPQSYKTILANIVLNGYRNMETYQLAIGDREGMAGLKVSAACNWNRISDKGDMQVPMTTLDKFLNGRKVDYVRMDVEGYEMSILKGMEHTLKTCRPRMFIEVHRDMLKAYGSSQRELMEYLASMDYRIEKSYIMGRDSWSGKISNLLNRDYTAKAITERGIASHYFFVGDK